jgi:transposase-like protein
VIKAGVIVYRWAGKRQRFKCADCGRVFFAPQKDGEEK